MTTTFPPVPVPARKRFHRAIRIGVATLAAIFVFAWWVVGWSGPPDPVLFDPATGLCQVEAVFEDGVPASFMPFSLIGETTLGTELLLPQEHGYDAEEESDARELNDYTEYLGLASVRLARIVEPFVVGQMTAWDVQDTVLTDRFGRFSFERPKSSSIVRVLPSDPLLDCYRQQNLFESSGKKVARTPLLQHLSQLSRSVRRQQTTGAESIVLPPSVPYIEVRGMKDIQVEEALVVQVEVEARSRHLDFHDVHSSVLASATLPKDLSVVRIPIVLKFSGPADDPIRFGEKIWCYIGSRVHPVREHRGTLGRGLLWKVDLHEE